MSIRLCKKHLCGKRQADDRMMDIHVVGGKKKAHQYILEGNPIIRSYERITICIVVFKFVINSCCIEQNQKVIK